MLKVFESDDRVSASLEEVKKLTELNQVLNERINSLLKEKQEVIKAAEYWKEQYLELESELAKRLENSDL
jgi:hypothetical protein